MLFKKSKNIITKEFISKTTYFVIPARRESLAVCHSDLFGLRLIENLSSEKDAGQASMTMSGQLAMTEQR